MTIAELSKYQSIKAEIKQLREYIDEIESTTISSSKINDLPVSGIVNNDRPTERIAFKLVDLRAKLTKKHEQLVDEMNKVEDFLSTVNDNEIRIIIRKRFLDGKTWKEVSKEIISDRSTPYYRLKKYFKERSLDCD